MPKFRATEGISKVSGAKKSSALREVPQDLCIPEDQEVDDMKQQQLCRVAVTGWNNLPAGVSIRSERLPGGSHSLVRMMMLEGEGADDIQPAQCVYAFYGESDFVIDRTNFSAEVKNNLIIACGEVGVGPKIYAVVGKHLVMEYCPGGKPWNEAAHFLSQMSWGPWFSHISSGAENVTLMEKLGTAVGTMHAICLEDLANTLNKTAAAQLKEQMASPVFFQLEGSEGSSVLREQILGSPSFPRHGLWAQSVCCHGDLHGDNIICDGESGSVQFVDWEFTCVGHRGVDLSYFFINAPGATMASRRAFANAYLSMQSKTMVNGLSSGSSISNSTVIRPETVDKFLWEIECCMPLTLLHCADIAFVQSVWLSPTIREMAKSFSENLKDGERRVGIVNRDVQADDKLQCQTGQATSTWRCVAKRMAVRKERSVKSEITRCLTEGSEIMAQGEPVRGWVQLLNGQWALIKHESLGQLLEKVTPGYAKIS